MEWCFTVVPNVLYSILLFFILLPVITQFHPYFAHAQPSQQQKQQSKHHIPSEYFQSVLQAVEFPLVTICSIHNLYLLSMVRIQMLPVHGFFFISAAAPHSALGKKRIFEILSVIQRTNFMILIVKSYANKRGHSINACSCPFSSLPRVTPICAATLSGQMNG